MLLRFVLLSILIAFRITPSFAEIWQYKDEKGTIKFVQDRTQIPSQFQSSASKVGGENVKVNAGASTGPAQPGVVVQSANPNPQPSASTTPSPDAMSAMNQAMMAAQHQGATSDEHVVDELNAKREQGAMQGQMMNAGNPLSGDFKIDVSKIDFSQLPPQARWLEKVAKHPKGQAFIQVIFTKEFQGHLTKIVANPNRDEALIGVLVLMLVLFLLKLKLKSDDDSLLKKLMMKLVFTLLFFAGSIGVYVYVYGDPLIQAFQLLFKAVMS